MAHGVCDGSYMSEASPDSATAAWLLEDSCLPCQGITHVSGPPSETNAYHTKLQGLHALLMAVKGLCSFHSITTRSVIMGCNNLGALHQAQQTQELTPCSSVHTDLIHAICRICCSLPGVTIHFKHVKGHQDDWTSASSLPRLAQLNILADQLAKHSLLHLLQHHQHQVGLLVDDAWSLQVNNQVVTSDPHPSILWHLRHCAAYKYMVEKKQFISSAGFPLINFPALSTTLKATSPLYQLWFSKLVLGHSATGHMMYLWGKWVNALCPCCGHNPETTQHVLICPDPCMTWILFQSASPGIMVVLSGHHARNPVLPTPRFLYGTTLPVFPLCQSLDTGSPGTRPHWLD